MWDKAAALKFLRKATKRYGAPKKVITDRLASYGAAMKEIGNIDRHELNTKVKVTSSGESKRMTIREVFVKRLVQKALEGSANDAIKLLAAVDKYVPELLIDDTTPDGIEVVFVRPGDNVMPK